MAQVFKPSANTLAKATIFGGLFFVAASVWALNEFNRSPYMTQAGVAREQPVPFSHKHHVGEVGLDCRYCHTSVEKAAFAGIPSTQICMNCHSQIWTEAPVLEPIRASYQSGKSVEWTRVNDLPDYVYFHHGAHIRAGVGCATCHGAVDTMNLTWQEATLHMEWCLDCHRNPEAYVRPREFVFDMQWQSEDQATLGPQLVEENDIHTRTDCTTCHR